MTVFYEWRITYHGANLKIKVDFIRSAVLITSFRETVKLVASVIFFFF